MSDVIATSLIVQGVLLLGQLGAGIRWYLERRERLKATGTRTAKADRATDRLKQYNALQAEQLADQDAEIDRLKAELDARKGAAT